MKNFQQMRNWANRVEIFSEQPHPPTKTLRRGLVKLDELT